MAGAGDTLAGAEDERLPLPPDVSVYMAYMEGSTPEQSLRTLLLGSLN